MNTVDRRNFLAQSAAPAGGSLLPFSNSARAEPPTETKKIRLIIDETICLAPQFLSAELLRLEGFTEVEYVRQNYREFPNAGSSIAASKADITQDAAISFIPLIDAGQPVVLLSGIHVGCWELFGGPRVHTIRDLRGKRVPIAAQGAEEHLVISSLLAYLGMDPRKDVEFVTIPDFEDQRKAFVAGSVDAIFAFPPTATEVARREDRTRDCGCRP